MEEIWKDITGYEGMYQVSNLGRVKSFRQGTKFGKPKEYILKPTPNASGYPVVTLYTGYSRRKFQVHRLVAMMFLPNPNNYPCVNHKDESKDNCHVDNLEWCTYLYNNNYGTARARAVEKRARPIRQMNLEGKELATYKSPGIAADLLNQNVANVRAWLLNGYGFGYRWEYI